MPFLSDPPTVDTASVPSSFDSRSQNYNANSTKPTMLTPTPTLPTNRTTDTTLTFRSNAKSPSRYSNLTSRLRHASTVTDDPVHIMSCEDERRLYGHLSTKYARGNYKPGSVRANGKTIVFDESNVRCDESDAGSDAAVMCDGMQIGGWQKDGDMLRWVHPGKEQGMAMRGLQPSKSSGEEGFGGTDQWMNKGTARDPTTHQNHAYPYHAYPKIHRIERPTSPLSKGIASTTNPKQSACIDMTSTVSNVASADTPTPLNAGNLTILNQQNKLSQLKPPSSLAQSTNPAKSTSSAKATCSYDDSDNEAAPPEWTAATAATATATAAAAGKNKKVPGYEHDDGKGKTHVTWGIVGAAEDHDVPDWDLIEEADATEEWNAIDILDRAAFTRDVEGWFLL
ncbi:hypothetical protein MMC22_011383 [Lobaria immixta]|nr:hypothetical protein [Lobaria immixta]